MNKIAQYLNEHLLGEVTCDKAVRDRFSRDGSILHMTPELVVHPRVTNDLRKIARFSWQLAEKGHILPITVRGGGSDKNGAAISKGIIVNTLAHLNKILYVSLKNKDQFIHAQPGVIFDTANDVLVSNGLIVPAFPETSAFSTVGGAVSNNAGGTMMGKYGQTGDYVNRMEVVLANGDIIETSLISKHELSKKKGLQTFEGEIYRKIDGIIEDNQQTIDNKIANNYPDNVGYPGIAKVKGRDGSFDLSQLLIGSQGTLGMISELVLRADYCNTDQSIIVAAFDSPECARDAADALTKLKPAILDVIDGSLFDLAHTFGKRYIFSEQYLDRKVGTVVYICFNDCTDHARKHNVKQALKSLSKFETTIYGGDDYSNDELQVIREMGSTVNLPINKDQTRPPIIEGAAIPAERREEFIVSMAELASKHHVDLPLHIQWMDGIVHVRPTLDLHIVSDKQKTFKLINDYMELVVKYGGSMSALSGEGRLRTNAAHAQLDQDELDVYNQIKAAFDPFGILNPGVKQKSDLKTLVSALDADYNSSDIAQYSPNN